MGRYTYWWTISPRWYHPPSSQCYYHWVDTSAGGLLVPDGIIRQVVHVPHCHGLLDILLFLNNVIIIKTKVLLPQPILVILCRSCGLLAPKEF
jgi:hypothetical protein